MKRLLSLCVLAVAAAMSCSCWAADYYFKDTPVSRMKKEDFAIANPVITRALDEGEDGKTYSWQNPKTGASGSVTPRSAAFARDKLTCRKAQVMVSAGGKKNVSSWTMCKQPDGWKVLE